MKFTAVVHQVHLGLESYILFALVHVLANRCSQMINVRLVEFGLTLVALFGVGRHALGLKLYRLLFALWSWQKTGASLHIKIIISHHTLVLLSLTLVAVQVLIEVDLGESVDLIRILLMHSSLPQITRIAEVLQIGS